MEKGIFVLYRRQSLEEERITQIFAQLNWLVTSQMTMLVFFLLSHITQSIFELNFTREIYNYKIKVIVIKKFDVMNKILRL